MSVGLVRTHYTFSDFNGHITINQNDDKLDVIVVNSDGSDDYKGEFTLDSFRVFPKMTDDDIINFIKSIFAANGIENVTINGEKGDDFFKITISVEVLPFGSNPEIELTLKKVLTKEEQNKIELLSEIDSMIEKKLEPFSQRIRAMEQYIVETTEATNKKFESYQEATNKKLEPYSQKIRELEQHIKTLEAKMVAPDREYIRQNLKTLETKISDTGYIYHQSQIANDIAVDKKEENGYVCVMHPENMPCF